MGPLEELEKLGALFEAKLLTEEEFQAEKQRLLALQQKAHGRDSDARRARSAVLIATGLVAATLGGASSYFFIHERSVSPRVMSSSADQSTQSEAVEQHTVQPLSITFKDITHCEPGPDFAQFLTMLREAASDQVNGGQPGSTPPPNTRTTVRNFGQQQVRLAAARVATNWHALPVREVRTAEWDAGNGFQIEFGVDPITLIRTLKEEGLTLDAVGKPSKVDGQYSAVERVPQGAMLTCMKAANIATSTEVESAE